MWFALNGPDVWALAYREYKASTRAAYAHAYPDNWFGVLSGPDSYDSFESSSAGQPSIPMYPVQDSLPPAWELFDTTAEAGIEAGATGYTIDPHWPFPGFRWETRVVGVSYTRSGASGYVRPASDGTLSMRVRIPGSAGSRPLLRIGSQVRRVPVRAGFAPWTMPVTSQKAITWALSAG